MSRWYRWDSPGYTVFGSFLTSSRRRFAVFHAPEMILIPGERADLFPDVKALIYKSDSLRSDRNSISDGFRFDKDPAFDKFFCLWIII